MGAANKLYNGNIAETFWSTATDGGFVRNYGYKYDNLNRLKDATYQKSGQLTNMYNENLSYDKNGNIMNLSRYGDRDEQYLPIQIDYLQYGYATNSNKLMSVVDNSNNTSGFKDGNTTGDDYVYDVNGNMTVDKNKNITSIVYNHLNLPTKIILPTGNIVYFYTASGQKVQKVVTENATVTTTDYLGGYQYQNTVLQYFPTAEGYVKNTPLSGTNTYSYVFNYTDHLGNTRLSYTKDPSTNVLTILDESNYYPFGMKHNGYNPISPAPEYKYRYNGKELQEELGLNTYDYGARNYDPALGRWMNIDPLAEKMRRHSLYNYAFNNPMRFTDPDGRAPDDIIIISGKQNLKYENGNLYNKNGSIYKGNDSYAIKVKNDLNQLSKDNKTLAGRINTLENSKQIHTISMTDKPADGNVNTPVSQTNDEKGIPTGSNTKYNPDNATNVRGDKRVARAGLAHELLGHGHDSDQGKADYSKTSNGIPMYEVNAVNMENRARAAAGDPQKTTYGGQPIPTKLLDDTHKSKTP